MKITNTIILKIQIFEKAVFFKKEENILNYDKFPIICSTSLAECSAAAFSKVG